MEIPEYSAEEESIRAAANGDLLESLVNPDTDFLAFRPWDSLPERNPILHERIEIDPRLNPNASLQERLELDEKMRKVIQAAESMVQGRTVADSPLPTDPELLHVTVTYKENQDALVKEKARRVQDWILTDLAPNIASLERGIGESNSILSGVFGKSTDLSFVKEQVSNHMKAAIRAKIHVFVRNIMQITSEEEVELYNALCTNDLRESPTDRYMTQTRSLLNGVNRRLDEAVLPSLQQIRNLSKRTEEAIEGVRGLRSSQSAVSVRDRARTR